MRAAGTNVIGETGNVTRVAHEDSGCDFADCRSLDGDRRAAETFIGVSPAAKRVVEYLTTLEAH